MEKSADRTLFPIVTVGGLINDAGGDLLLVRTEKWSGKWGIPGGKVEYGETLEEAFRREIWEETGLKIYGCRLVMVQDCVENPEFHVPRHFVLINYVAHADGKRPEVRLNYEASDYLWTSSATALGMDLNGPTRALLLKTLEEGG